METKENNYLNYSDTNLLKYAGNFESVNTVRRIEITEGRARGLQAYDIRCFGGLDLLILIDRGLDIAQARFKGKNISFMTKNGLTGPIAPAKTDSTFVNNFTGGLLTTCGLRNAGPSCTDTDGEFYPLHGNYNSIPAKDVGVIQSKNHIIEVFGTVRESAIFGHNLVIKRSIKIDALNSVVEVNDTLENESVKPQEFLILYHYNFGFPFLHEDTYVEFVNDKKVIPRTEHAKAGLKDHAKMSAPIDNYEEQVYFHDLEPHDSGFANVVVTNPSLKLKAKISYKTDNLPILVQWKSMASTDYALGIEPSNSYLKGRKIEREDKTIKVIPPLSKLEFKTSFSIEEID